MAYQLPPWHPLIQLPRLWPRYGLEEPYPMPSIIGPGFPPIRPAPIPVLPPGRKPPVLPLPPQARGIPPLGYIPPTAWMVSGGLGGGVYGPPRPMPRPPLTPFPQRY
jgi:hypothetical protein